MHNPGQNCQQRSPEHVSASKTSREISLEEAEKEEEEEEEEDNDDHDEDDDDDDDDDHDDHDAVSGKFKQKTWAKYKDG